MTECDQSARYRITRGDGSSGFACRCMICERCHQHTGNYNQGHYWSWCSVTKRDRGFHFCCPGNCEREAAEDV